MYTIAPLFMGSSSSLQVTRTTIKSWRDWNSGQIHLLILELCPLKHWKKQCGHDSAFIFYQMNVKLAGNQDRHKILDEFDYWPDQTIRFEVTCP